MFQGKKAFIQNMARRCSSVCKEVENLNVSRATLETLKNQDVFHTRTRNTFKFLFIITLNICVYLCTGFLIFTYAQINVNSARECFFYLKEMRKTHVLKEHRLSPQY